MTARPLPVAALAALAALLLSGCFGYPPGSAHPGDQVNVRFTVTDLATGATLANGQSATFLLGAGHSGLGGDVEHAFIGLAPNATIRMDSKDAAERGYTVSASVPEALDNAPFDQVVSVAQFTARLGAPTVGQSFQVSALYNATVVSVEGGNVTYRLAVHDGQVIPIPSLGIGLLHRIVGGDLVRSLVAVPDATFVVQANPVSGQTPLGLEPGSYKTVNGDGTSIHFVYFPGPAAFLLRPIHVEATLVSVTHASAPVAPSGAYGVRASPQVLGDVSAFVPHDVETATPTRAA